MAQETVPIDTARTPRGSAALGADAPAVPDAPVVEVRPQVRPQAAAPRLRTLPEQTVERRQAELESSHRYSRFVHWMKIALPIFALGLVGVIVLYAGFEQQKSGVDFSFSRVSLIDDDLTMISPRFSGTDSKARPFVVTADQARQDANDPNLVYLDQIEADLELPGVAWLFLNSDHGELHTETKGLKLDGSVHIRSDLGYDLVTEALDVDIEAAEARSRAPVAGEGPIGRLRADEMTIYDEGRRLVFEGRVKTLLRPSQKEEFRKLKDVSNALKSDAP